MKTDLDIYFIWRCGNDVRLGNISFVPGAGAESYHLLLNNRHYGSIFRRVDGAWGWPDDLTADDRDAIKEIVGDQIEW